MKAKIIKKNEWEQDLFDIIEWDNFGIVFHNMKEIDKIQLFKISHGMLPVMRHQYATSNMYPVCNATKETIVHMLQCQVIKTDGWKIDLQHGLKKSGLVPQHEALLLYCITCFGSNTTPSAPSHHSAMAHTLVNDQTTMGWHHFLQVKLIKDWVDVFNKERRDGGKKEDDPIMVKVVTAITPFTLNLWPSRCSQVFREQRFTVYGKQGNA